LETEHWLDQIVAFLVFEQNVSSNRAESASQGDALGVETSRSKREQEDEDHLRSNFTYHHSVLIRQSCQTVELLHQLFPDCLCETIERLIHLLHKRLPTTISNLDSHLLPELTPQSNYVGDQRPVKAWPPGSPC
jgi:hypothetical protein